MLSLLAAAVIRCMPMPPHPPPPPPPPQIVRCEGFDLVRRTNWGAELTRQRNACRPPERTWKFGLSSR